MQLRRLIMMVFVLTMGTALSINAQVNPEAQQEQASMDFSDATLEAFVDANMEIQKVQMEGKEQMKQAIENQENLDIPTYRKIITSKRSSGEEEAEVSEEEMKAFEAAQEEIKGVQMEIQNDMRTVVENHELSVREYQEIQQAYQSDKELQEKIMNIQKAKMEMKAKEQSAEGMN